MIEFQSYHVVLFALMAFDNFRRNSGVIISNECPIFALAVIVAQRWLSLA